MLLTDKEQLAKEKVCLPLDGLNSIEEVKKRIEELSSVVGLFKIGKESYTRFGPAVIELVHKYDAKVFLDLKYHDIPNTVKGAANAAANLGIYMFNVHASGGSEMMKAAMEGARKGAEESGNRVPKVIAVTILTSLDQNALNNELNIHTTVEEQVLNLAKLTLDAGLNGIVCSAADLYAIHDKLPKNFMYVTPGIKGPNTEAGKDQKRVFTPGNAVKDGSSILVVGRTITGHKTSEQRIKAGYEILKDIATVL
jgi:orotidine-5'-phosphate decarboxylase